MMIECIKFFIPHFTKELVAVWEDEDGEYHIWKPLCMFGKHEESPDEVAYLRCFKWLFWHANPTQEMDVYEVVPEEPSDEDD